MSQLSPTPDPGYRVDGGLPPGFDVAALLAQLYGGQRLVRGTAIPIGAATVTITAEHLDIPGSTTSPAPPPPPPPAGALTPPPAAPVPGALTPPAAAPATPVASYAVPGEMTDPNQLAALIRERVAGAQIGANALGPEVQQVIASMLESRLSGRHVDANVVIQTMRAGAAAPHGNFVNQVSSIASSMSQRLSGSKTLSQVLHSSATGGDAIRAHDPGFTEAGLVAEATAALYALLQARASIQPAAVRRFVCDALFAREERQIQSDSMQGHRRVVDGFEVRSVTIHDLAGSATGDHATVRFLLYGADHDVDMRGKRVAGDKKPTAWHEHWVLARNGGSTTPPPGTPVPACAVCGFAGAAPTDAICRSCSRPLPAPPGAWIVAGVLRVEPRRA